MEHDENIESRDRFVIGGDVPAALSLLTRIPAGDPPRRGARAAWAWPLAGLAVGALAGLIGAVALLFGTAEPLAAALALAALIALTGGLHEDGLADTADGLWGAPEPARRLAIMRDSRIGSYGVLALGLSLILRWQALSIAAAEDALWPVLIAASVLSRAPMACLAALLPHARSDGLGRSTGRPSFETVLLGSVIALVLALVFAPWGLLQALALIFFVTLGMLALAKAKLGGQTGDILGATQQVCEIAALVALASVLA